LATTVGQAYIGYHRRDVPEPDPELTRVGPGTPCGEYFRRFWHPVALADDLKDLPLPLRILGEDLVLFRDGRGAIGLLNRHCAHRGTSLEFGIVERCGIRCPYHGWLYDVDGRVLETPGELPESAIKDRVVHGAYPTREYKGLIFAYMGPPEHQPEFALISSVENPPPGWRIIARPGPGRLMDSNWLQRAENIIDHAHLAFLHFPEMARALLTPYRPSANPEATLDDYFNRGLPEVYEPVYRQVTQRYHAWRYEWHEFAGGVLSIRAERFGEHVHLRVGNYIMPNIVEFAPPRRRGAIGTELVDREVGYEPPEGTDWQIPIDDTHTLRLGFDYVADTEDARRQEVVRGETEVKPQSFTQHKREDYAARQREPADYEAQQGRPIAIHALEHLGTTDRGVMLIRKQLREGIRAVQHGDDPIGVARVAGQTVPSHCRNTILRLPPAADPEADIALVERAKKRFAAALIAGDDPIAAALQREV
jgi:nitrite reductase/ring-hydroxylating ferredoxin subunit